MLSQPQSLSMTALAGIGDILPGDDLADVLVKAICNNNIVLKDGDILVIAHKVVFKNLQVHIFEFDFNFSTDFHFIIDDFF